MGIDLAKGKSVISQFELNSDLKEVFEDIQHFKALKECYGESQLPKTMMYISLLSVDLSGKMAGWIVEAPIARSIHLGMKSIMSKERDKVPGRLARMRHILKLAFTNRSLMEKVTDPVWFISYLSGVYSTQKTNQLIHGQLLIDQSQRANDLIKETVKFNQELELELSRTQDPQMRAVIQEQIDANKKDIEIIQKSYLDNQLIK